jgi:hypothetical protein
LRNGALGYGLEGVEELSRMQELPREQVQRHVSFQRLVPRMVNRPIPRPVGDALAISDVPTVDEGTELVALRLSPADYEMLT